MQNRDGAEVPERQVGGSPQSGHNETSESSPSSSEDVTCRASVKTRTRTRRRSLGVAECVVDGVLGAVTGEELDVGRGKPAV